MKVQEEPELIYSPLQQTYTIGDKSIGIEGQLERVMLFAGKCEPKNSLRIRFNFRNDRFIRCSGQQVSNTRDAISHIIGSRVDITFGHKFHGDLRHFFARHRFDGSDTLNARERIFERLGDL